MADGPIKVHPVEPTTRIELPDYDMNEFMLAEMNKAKNDFNRSDYRFRMQDETAVKMRRSEHKYKVIQGLSLLNILPSVLFPVSIVYQMASRNKFRTVFAKDFEILDRFNDEFKETRKFVHEMDRHIRGAQFSNDPLTHQYTKNLARQFIHFVASTHQRDLDESDYVTKYQERLSWFSEQSMDQWSVSDADKVYISDVVNNILLPQNKDQPFNREQKNKIDGMIRILSRALAKERRFSSDDTEHRQIKRNITLLCAEHTKQQEQAMSTHPSKGIYTEFKNKEYAQYVELFLDMSEWPFLDDTKQRFERMRDVLLFAHETPPTAEQATEMKDLFSLLEVAVVSGATFSSDPVKQKETTLQLNNLCKLGPYTDRINEVEEFRKFGELFSNVRDWDFPPDVKSRFHALKHILTTQKADTFTQAQRDEIYAMASLLNDNMGRRMTSEQKVHWERDQISFENHYSAFKYQYARSAAVNSNLNLYKQHVANRKEYNGKRRANLGSVMFKVAGGFSLATFALTGSLLATTGLMFVALPLAPVVAFGYWQLNPRWGHKGKTMKAEYERVQFNVQNNFANDLRNQGAAIIKANQNIVENQIPLHPEQMRFGKRMAIPVNQWGNARIIKKLRRRNPAHSRQLRKFLDLRTPIDKWRGKSPIIPILQNPREMTI